MKQDNTYNGWSNWETWNFKLWIDNDYHTYLHFESMVEANKGKLLKIAQDLKEFAQYQERQYNRLTETGKPLTSGFMVDLKGRNASINDIDYMEIAKHIKEDSEVITQG
tara:strand:- start:75 stop:401 length:327 start_codon:yes stop_codon:yes gene_type:complete